MANDNLDDYELFYQEIPAHQDYLSGFDTEIEDLVEEAPHTQGLDANQVSQLAQDTIYGKDIIPKSEDSSSDSEQSLFEAE